jgi:hypothetical protein
MNPFDELGDMAEGDLAVEKAIAAAEARDDAKPCLDEDLAEALKAASEARERYEHHSRQKGQAFLEHEAAGARVAEILKDRYGAAGITIQQLSDRPSRASILRAES